MNKKTINNRRFLMLTKFKLLSSFKIKNGTIFLEKKEIKILIKNNN